VSPEVIADSVPAWASFVQRLDVVEGSRSVTTPSWQGGTVASSPSLAGVERGFVLGFGVAEAVGMEPRCLV